MGADPAFAAEALAHARRASAIAFVPRATIAELAGRTLYELRRDGAALGLSIGRQRVREVTEARPPLGSRHRPSNRLPAAKPRGTRGGRASVETAHRAVLRGAEREDTSPIDRLAVGRAMERFIASRVAAYEADGGNDPEPEKTARTIGHYARALGLVRGYLADIEKDAETHDEAPARSLSDLRDELRRHLERIWDEDEDAGGLGGAGDDAR